MATPEQAEETWRVFAGMAPTHWIVAKKGVDETFSTHRMVDGEALAAYLNALEASRLSAERERDEALAGIEELQELARQYNFDRGLFRAAELLRGKDRPLAAAESRAAEAEGKVKRYEAGLREIVDGIAWEWPAEDDKEQRAYHTASRILRTTPVPDVQQQSASVDEGEGSK